MKKYIAILSLLVLFLAQFGRVINYCVCTIATYEQTSSFSCDCERQLFAAVSTAQANRDQTPANIYFQHPSEELFDLSNCSIILSSGFARDSHWPATVSAKLLHGFANNVFRPPLCAS